MYYNIRRNSEAMPTQITWEDVIAGVGERNFDDPTTFTYRTDKLQYSETGSTLDLKAFRMRHMDLYKADKSTLYDHYMIPKKTGGYRPIDDPHPELRQAFDEMITLIRRIQGGDLYTTAAYAYVKGRSPLDCAKKHAKGTPDYVLHMDLHNFFNGITLDFIVEQLGKVNPWASFDKKAVREFFELIIKDGGCVQGSTVSPLVSNLVMIEFDYILMHYCYDNGITYTRYADDLYFSSRHGINIIEIEQLVDNWIKNSKAKFCRNKEKQHYGSTKGKSYVLGVLLTKDHGIKYGSQRVRLLKAALFSCLMDYKNGRMWSEEDVRELGGNLSWALQVDPEYINKVIQHLEEKTGVKFKDVRRKLKI